MATLRMGPGAMVAAAFIGPGTITTATAAGAQFGLGLLWAIGFSVLATLVLQELALRTALATGRDLAALMRDVGDERWWGRGLLALIVVAIGIGNAAYQSGNLAGAALGMSWALDSPAALWVCLCAGISGVLIWQDTYRGLERVLVALVLLMALLFLALGAFALPLLIDTPAERLAPSAPPAAHTLILALIGTTVVPYNLFLHATAARRRWQGTEIHRALREARFESTVSIVVGGLITAIVVIVGAAFLPPDARSGGVLALLTAVDQMLPGWGGLTLGLGLFAAGLTSAIAAPVSAGWAVCGAMGWPLAARSIHFRGVAYTVLTTGLVFAALADRPESLIILAQATNGLLLPVIAIALVMVATQERWLGIHRSGTLANALALLVVALVTLLAASRLWALLP